MTPPTACPRNGAGIKSGGNNAYSSLSWWCCNVRGALGDYACNSWDGVMTYEQALAYNKAIEDALREYKNGIGAIRQLKMKFAVDVEHVGTTTKQEVRELD